MTEQGSTPPPEQLLQLKDEMVECWRQLPDEHRATMALMLIKEILESDYGDWLRQALSITVLSPKKVEG